MSAPPQSWQPAGPSGMFQAGRILMLVAAILAAALAIFTVGFGLAFDNIMATADEPFPLKWFGTLYIVTGVVTAIGAVFGFIGYSKARQGDARGAFIFGLVSSLVPPVQVLMLVAAILCKVSPEGEG